jgi:NAD dependent epimerase/dehydratase family enzyme
MNAKPDVLVSASAVGYYGSRGDEILTEESAPGNDFLGQLAKDWEAEALRAEAVGTRRARTLRDYFSH